MEVHVNGIEFRLSPIGIVVGKRSDRRRAGGRSLILAHYSQESEDLPRQVLLVMKQVSETTETRVYAHATDGWGQNARRSWPQSRFEFP